MPVRQVVVAALVAVAAVPVVGTPAHAHGAPTSPVSRAAACGPEGGQAGNPACQAAIASGAALREWDNIRVFGVDGKDRERIPDGELCSGGLSAYRGLDLARDDWPATELTGGTRFTFRYRATIPHEGTFRLYLTRADYDPSKRLRWADLERAPFIRVTDPPLRDGAYQFAGRLPERTGRHLIYTVWQNSDSRDTYYSCSDVVFMEPAGRAGLGGPGRSPAPAAEVPVEEGTTKASPVAAEGGGSAGARTSSESVTDGVPVATVTDLDRAGWPVVGGAGAALTLLLAVVVAARLRRAGSVPVGRPCEVRNHRAGRQREW
ncbi:lytic polysaccharide monooxygenase auxiliary activity family 9 protein [Micromonospora sp. H33]|uniref:lytic polysaccharide monooxygenase auxiliary activity family 9 protein n=1 Tax=Micromonospora sp. H33 TaxID=3452215 RepID=UPI003F88893A